MRQLDKGLNNDKIIISNLMDLVHEVSKYLDTKASLDRQATNVTSTIKELARQLKEERKNARESKS